MLRAFVVIVVCCTALSAQIPTSISGGTKDEAGILTHQVQSDYQAGKTQIRVLLPDKLEKDRRYPVVYVLSLIHI